MKPQIFSDDKNNVKKLVFDFGNAIVESVLYKYPTYEERTVICCSVMSGCPMGCRFCGTGDFYIRNLTSEEIVHQVVSCIEETRVDAKTIHKLQIMFMSMGEPALNQKHLVNAIRTLHGLYPYAALLISTSAPDVSFDEIFDVSTEIAMVGLQFSIHESTDTARDKLIPFKKKMTLYDISSTGNIWFSLTGRKPFFNYCAHELNSTIKDADRLLELFDPRIWNATVSVICERDNSGIATANEHQRNLAIDFSSKLVDRGFDVRVFDPAGQDTIGGGCGQLWFVQEWVKKNPSKARFSIGNNFPKMHIPIKIVL